MTDRDKYYLGIAKAVASGAKCTRSQVGAVIVNDNRIVGCGKNGSPPGMRECTEGACPRGRHYIHGAFGEPVLCGCGHSWPCPEYIPPGGDYDTLGPGQCIALHAEVNACIDAGRRMAKHGTIYITREPCYGCIKVIQASQILRLVYLYENSSRALDFPFVHFS